MDVSEFQGAIHAVVGKWKIEILRTLMGGPRSFGELRRSPSRISQHIATAPERARRADWVRTCANASLFKPDRQLSRRIRPLNVGAQITWESGRNRTAPSRCMCLSGGGTMQTFAESSPT
jgi:hypothetical protein